MIFNCMHFDVGDGEGRFRGEDVKDVIDDVGDKVGVEKGVGTVVGVQVTSEGSATGLK